MSDVLMPQMGESIVEGTITRWLKQVGDQVERDEALLEISTDKVDSEVPSPVSGTLEEILAEEGSVVEINKVIARIAEGGAASKPAKAEKAEAPAEEAAAQEEEKPAAAAEEASGEAVRSSPLVRRMAREEGIDLSQVSGSGPGGRITKKDLEAHLAAPKAAPAPAAAPAPKPAPAAAPAAPAAPAPAAAAAAPAAPAGGYNPFPAAPDSRFGDYYAEPLSTMRKRIAEHMVRSMHHTAPHVSMVHQFDCTAIVKARAAAKDKFLEQNGIKLTFMPFFMKAAAAALKEFPMVNASLDGDDIIYHRDINLGIAVALDWGLMVPVIKQADNLSIVGLQKALNDLADRSRKKQLKPDELKESSFSISNYGSYGSVFATPAINQPNSALLGLGALHKAPVVVGDAIAIRSICYATLTIDHRLIDGALAAKFLEHMRATIEGWTESVL
ncbi:MAG: 2-oxoglutarate dehydrogenase, E2 component, dihydrolipoamide succinyltransferase [Acidobacteria bacterium]|nr:2-oxoglutarate dehydrogenase, E2 component, dihydrolipoamide succinyltransferase [Acidobacteriota bacterium]